MKELKKYYDSLNELMESEAGKSKLRFSFPDKRIRSRRSHYLLAAALALIIPVTVLSGYANYRARKLINEENSYYIESIFKEDLFTFDYRSNTLPESDWFEIPESIFYQ